MRGTIRVFFLVGSAFVAWGLWLAELHWGKGWAGLAWASRFSWCSIPICALIAVAASYFVGDATERTRRGIFIAVAFLISMTAFVVVWQAALELFSGGFPGRRSFLAGVVAIVIGLVVAIGLTFAANRWLAPMHSWASLLVIIGLVLVLPLSFVTIRVFPASNGSTDQLHAIKMGYPVFWTALLVPVALRLGRKRG